MLLQDQNMGIQLILKIFIGFYDFVRTNINPLSIVSTNDTPTFDINSSVVNDDGSPNFIELDDSGLQSSRWQIQLGLRYIFN